LHLPIFPFDLVELVPSLSLVYINSATSRTHEVGKRQPSRPRLYQTHQFSYT
jgi:hypothetical protein